MSLNMICPQCGFENKTIGVFCAKCGVKMSKPEFKRQRRSWGQGLRVLVSLVRLVIILGLLLALGALLWPVKAPEIFPEPRFIQAFDAKMDRLAEAAEQSRVMAEVFQQEEINHFLAKQVFGESESERGLTGGLEALVFTLGKDRVGILEVIRLVGPMQISFQVEGVPEVVDGRFRLRLTRAQVGHLPLPVKLSGWVAGKIQHAVSGLEREQAVFRRVSRVELVPGKARIVTK